MDSSKDDIDSVNENVNNEDFIPVLNEEIKLLFDRCLLYTSDAADE